MSVESEPPKQGFLPRRPLWWRIRRKVVMALLGWTESWAVQRRISAKQFAKLTPKERQYICDMLKAIWNEDYKDVHQGMLPFAHPEHIRSTLWIGGHGFHHNDGKPSIIMRKLSWRMYYWHKLYEAL